MPSKKTIVIEAKDNTKQAFNKVSKNLNNMDTSVNATARSMDKLKGAIKGVLGAISLTAFASATRSTLEYADALGKPSARLGITTTALQTLRFAATQSGMTTEALEMSMQRFTRRLAEASQGTGVLKDTFGKLGMSIRNTDGSMKTAEQMLGEVADKLAEIPDQGERVRLAFQMFDSEGVKMVNMLQGGSGALDDMRKKLEATGAVLSEDFIKKSEAANDAIDLLQNQLKAGFGKAISGLAEPIRAVAEGLGDVILLAQEHPTITKMAGAVTTLSISVGLLGGKVTLVLTAVTGLVTLFSAWSSATKKQAKELDLQGKSLDQLYQLQYKYGDLLKVEEARLESISHIEGSRDWGGVKKRVDLYKSYVDQINSAMSKLKPEIEIIGEGTKALEKKNEVFERTLESQKLFASQLDQEFAQVQELNTIWGDYMDQQLLKEQEIADQKSAIWEQYLAEQTAIITAEEQARNQLMQTTISNAKQAGDILYSEGVMGFEAMRALAYTEALVNAQLGATKALAQGGMWGWAAAAAIYAAALSRAYQIKNMEPPSRREYGGPVSGGGSYLVGERGPEMFTPNTSGSITPSNKLGGTTVNMNINAVDASGIDQLLYERRSMIKNLVSKAIKEDGGNYDNIQMVN